MGPLKWDQTGEKFYETGVDKAVLYPMENGAYPKGYAWNGISSISENPSGAEPTAVYADNQKYLNLMSAEEYAATIEAYQSPDEFDECDGTKELAPGVYVGQQARKQFGLSYRTLLGNDTDGTDHGYKLHLVYGGLAAPSEKNYNTVNDSPETMTLSWSVSTTPVEITKEVNGKKLKPTACITIDSTKVDAKKLKAIEDKLYGTSTSEAMLPLPDDILTILTTEG